MAIQSTKDLPPVERKRDGSLYSMTPAQHKQAKGLLRRECCSYDDGNCLEQDDGDAHLYPVHFLLGLLSVIP